MQARRGTAAAVFLAGMGAACAAPVPLGAGSAGSAGSGGGASGSAGTGPAADPWAAPDVCAGGTYWSGQGTKDMTPGLPCLGCHGPDQGTAFVVAGTAFTTGHVPDACEATPAQQAALGEAQVFVEDAAGVVLPIHVWPSGNFMQKAVAAPLVFPIKAWVRTPTGERPMLSAQMSGDCNACHSDGGDAGAPGRIVLP